MTLSVCLIVKNEREVIARCLNCALKFADEIIVVDTGSSDNTVEEVKKFTDKVYFFEWCNDFSAARNFALSKATCDLLMWLDADDVITDENCDKINDIKAGFGDIDIAYLPYAAAFDGDTPTTVYYRERIFKRSENFKFEGAVHEAVTPHGKVAYFDAVINHKKVKVNEPMRNLRILQGAIAEGKQLDERQKFYYGRELLFNNMYREAIAVLEDFLNGGGWAENKAEACLNLFYAYSAIGDIKKAQISALRSFLYGLPKSQTCCIIGERFFNSGEYQTAIFWYKTALEVPCNEREGGFVNRDFGGFIPLMQLCVLYDRLGDYETAQAYNEKAGKIKPQNENYLANKNYFLNRRG